MIEQFIFMKALEALFDANIGVKFINRYKEGIFLDQNKQQINFTNSVFFHFPRIEHQKGIGNATKSSVNIDVYVCYHNYAEAYVGIREQAKTEAKSKSIQKSFEDTRFKDRVKSVLNGFKIPFSSDLELQNEEIFLEDKSIIVFLLSFKIDACDWNKIESQCI